MASQKSRKQYRQKAFFILAVILLAAVIAGITMLTTVVRKYSPSKETTDYASYYGLETEEDILISYDNEILEEKGLYLDGEVYVPYDVLHSYLNARFYWDSTEQILRYTLPEGIVEATADTAQYTVAKESRTAEYTVLRVLDGQMYLSLSFAAQYTDIRWEYYEEPNRVVISDIWGEVEYTTVKHSTQLRELGGIKSSILTEMEKDDRVLILEELDSWAQVCTEDGLIGYMKLNALGDEQTEMYASNYEEPVYTRISRDYTINMAWHQVTTQESNSSVSSVLSATTGVNVISPTGFYLNDNSGGIASLVSADYVTYCHEQGVEVWALVSNLENSEVDTTQVLSVTSARDALVNNLISEAVKYDLDGINVDFESLEGEAGTGFLQFIRELSLKCESNGLILSVDNYAPASYNLFYNREEQAVFADYIVLMAYDEHYNSSDEGSVASLSFVTQAVEDTLEEVSADQLILGIPFYTRLWKLTPEEGTDDGSYTVTSEALGMSEAEARVAANGAVYEWLEDCGQYYAEYEYDGSTYKVWLEDQNSIAEKLKVRQSYGLAGASFWKLGFEKNTVWNTIAEYLH
ncbi:MAG: glycosyl hydrolase family 18 protein [Clostridiales bacterium]|nr:glycosyl hydrolase family 18 protein [Clostridiales bacterium]